MLPNTSGADSLGTILLTVIYFIDRYLVPFIFALAFIVFLWGIYSTFIAGAANEEKRQEGQKILIYGMAGFFIMISLWGLVNILVGTFRLGSSRPDLPIFGAPTSSTKSTNPFGGSTGGGSTGGGSASGGSGAGTCSGPADCAPGYHCDLISAQGICRPDATSSNGECQNDTDCAPGYKCAPISGESACIPK